MGFTGHWATSMETEKYACGCPLELGVQSQKGSAFMKNGFRVFGKQSVKLCSVVLVAVIGVLMTACPTDTPEPLTPPAPTVTSVTVSPSSPTIERGATENFTATVTGAGDLSQNVTWSIVEANRHEQTAINSRGVLTVSAAESLEVLTVRATSTFDPTMSGSATVA